MNIKLTFTVDEVQAIANVLGQTPTSSGLYPLLMNIKEQAEAQMVPMDEPVAEQEK